MQRSHFLLVFIVTFFSILVCDLNGELNIEYEYGRTYLTNSTLHANHIVNQINPSSLLVEIPSFQIACGGSEQALDRKLRHNVIRVICLHCTSQNTLWLLKYSYKTSDHLLGVHPYLHYVNSGVELTTEIWDNYTVMNDLLAEHSSNPILTLYGAQYSQANQTTKSYSSSTMSSKDQTIVADILVVCKQPKNETMNSIGIVTLSGDLSMFSMRDYSFLYIIVSVAVLVSVCGLGLIAFLACALCEKRTRKSLRRYSVILKNNNAWSMMKEEEIASFDGSRQFKEIGYVQAPLVL